MNRRSFLKRIAIAAAGVACGASLLSDNLTAKVVDCAKRINPAWVNAQYDMRFLFGADAYKRLIPSVVGPLPGIVTGRCNADRIPILQFLEPYVDTRSEEEKHWDMIDQKEFDESWS